MNISAIAARILAGRSGNIARALTMENSNVLFMKSLLYFAICTISSFRSLI